MSVLPEIGAFSLALALAAALYATVAAGAGAYWGVTELAESGRRALLATAVLTTAATFILAQRLVAQDFGLRYVWLHSSQTMSLPYRVAALWGGQAGSLLFWCWLLTLQGALFVRRPWPAIRPLVYWYVAVAAAISCFFLGLTALVANPFERLAAPAVSGQGLNPLLRHPGMALHPPALYLGFTGLVIPYALAMASLLSRRYDTVWLHAGRRPLLASWLGLTLGLVLGARWAYDVLGWGGYWGWDPVENAGLLPWLSATALLHSAIVQVRRGLFQLWNLALASLTFWLVVLGTFLTRGGLVTSVHAFAQSEIGPSFLFFTALVTIGTLGLLWRRLPELPEQSPSVSALSRETAFLLNNLLFMAALFGVLWGTLLPMLTELTGGQRVTVGPPYFVAVVVPMLWAIVLWMAAGPLTTWQRATPGRMWRAGRPAIGAAAVTVALLALLGWRDWLALVAAGAAVLAGWVAWGELVRLARAGPSRPGSGRFVGARLARRHRAIGAHLVHLGVAVLAIGIVASNRFDQAIDTRLRIGQSAVIGAYRISHSGLEEVPAADRTSIMASLEVSRSGRSIGWLQPRRDWYRDQEDQPVTVPALLHRPVEDLLV